METLRVIDEYNDKGHLIYLEDYIGAYVRGKTREEALKKLPAEAVRYKRWLGLVDDKKAGGNRIVQEKISDLQICDADSDVIFDSERLPLTKEEYEKIKFLALKSAKDFLMMYESVPDKTGTVLLRRKTFYGEIPITAREMYEHTKNVNAYYFGEIDVPAENEPDLYTCRAKAFEILESQPDFLENTVYDGSYGEQWSLRKVCRRFIWHDCIHGKAMYRMAVRLCGKEKIKNPFCFEIINGE
ncbi:MAG: hypothetical protein KH828_08330 [Clostridiales bacterium]|nr:hypothetical protein [Clostridiales bacterium]